MQDAQIIECLVGCVAMFDHFGWGCWGTQDSNEQPQETPR